MAPRRSRQAEPPRQFVLDARLLGGCAIHLNGQPLLEHDLHHRAFDLLLRLLVTPGHWFSWSQVQALYWPDHENSKESLKQLQKNLNHRARESGPHPLITLANGRVAFAPTITLAVDLDAFEAAARAALESKDPAALRRAAALYTGPLLPDHQGKDWVPARQSGLTVLRVEVLTALAGAKARDDPEAAIATWRDVLALRPTDEEAARSLMRLLRQARRDHEAIAVYEAVVAALAAEHKQPNGLTMALRNALGDGRRNDNLPRLPTSFIGRERERAEVLALPRGAQGEPHPLVTLTGPAGIGKTRLALAVAADLLPHYADGVWLVQLEFKRAAEELVPAVLRALDLREERGRTPLDTLLEYLQHKELLLVLDTCEHLLEACAAFVRDVLEACPGVRILATSRAPILRGTSIYQVPPLALPDPGEAVALARLAGIDAVRLFLERAREARRGFQLSEANAAQVAAICRDLDGLPLAIELAAAMMFSMDPEKIQSNLDARLRLLTDGPSGASPRHRSLRAALEWSYDLLAEPERALLRALAVFAGGATVEAARAVAAEPELDEPDALRLLDALARQSMVTPEEWDGGMRYRLLETMRLFALERLREAGEERATHERHLAYFLALAEQAESRLLEPEQGTWLARLEAEHDNLRAARRWAGEAGETERGLRLAGALWRFWSMHSYLSEGRNWLEGLLIPAEAQDPSSGASVARAKALKGAGTLAHMQGDYARAMVLYEESLALARELGEKRGVAAALNNLGIAAHEQGDYGRATALYEECLALLRELGDTSAVAAALHNLGNVAWRQREFAQATALHEESLALERELGNSWGIANSLNALGNLAYERGDYARAKLLHEESLALSQELGDVRSIAISLSNLGHVAWMEGDPSRAWAMLQESLTLYQDLGSKQGVAESLEGMARVASAQSATPEILERAAQFLGAAAALRATIGAPLPPNERAAFDSTVDAARAALGETTWAAAWAAGQALPLEQAIALALGEPSPA